MSVSATARVTGASKVTVLKLLRDMGSFMLTFQSQMFVDLPCTDIQCDELWSFVGKKQRPKYDDPTKTWRGDTWIWTAMCATSKLVPVWHVGSRSVQAARTFMADLASRLAGRVQITTDGLGAYVTAVERAFGWGGADYGMLVKVYGDPPRKRHKYAQQSVVDVTFQTVMGKPDASKGSTSFVERQNLTLRQHVRRLTRSTNAFSKTLENHAHAVALHYAYYNLCRPHQTLTGARGGLRTTPAMAIGLTHLPWRVIDLVRLFEAS